MSIIEYAGKSDVCSKCGETKKIVLVFDAYEKLLLCKDCALNRYPCDFCEIRPEINSYKKHLLENHTAEMMAEKLVKYKLDVYSP
ncbi:MAG: hypothetical protein E6L03_02450 [Thaumarchaeota archaeon]|nr:MAG: hypothetical protein E6L03_02450 [Nitrososphaerota archaeon]